MPPRQSQASPPEPTTALAEVERREQHPLVVALRERMENISTLLPAGTDAERFRAVVLATVLKQPELLECTPASVLSAVLEAAQDGLEPTGAAGGAHLVVFRVNAGDRENPRWQKQAQLIRDYRGIIRLLEASGAATRVDSHVVHAKDEFSLDYGDLLIPIHHRPFVDGDPGEVRGYYALFLLPDGSRKAEYMTRAEVEAVRSTSRAKDAMAWTTFYDQMARKTVIKRGANYLNLRPSVRERLQAEDDAEYGDGPIVEVVRDERLAAGRQAIAARTARLAGGEPATVEPAPTNGAAAPARGAGTAQVAAQPAAAAPDAVTCSHPASAHEARPDGLYCQLCGTRLAQRDPNRPAEQPRQRRTRPAAGGAPPAPATPPEQSIAPAPVAATASVPAATVEVDRSPAEVAPEPTPAPAQAPSSAAAAPPPGSPPPAAQPSDDINAATVAAMEAAKARGLPENWAQLDGIVRATGRNPDALTATEWLGVADGMKAGTYDDLIAALRATAP